MEKKGNDEGERKKNKRWKDNVMKRKQGLRI